MTETAQQTLTDFLLARIAEDEAVAMSPAVMQTGISSEYSVDPIAPILNVAAGRVLAECEAKRRIIAWVTDETVICEVVADPVLGALAVPYADHPDYRAEWRL